MLFFVKFLQYNATSRINLMHLPYTVMYHHPVFTLFRERSVFKLPLPHRRHIWRKLVLAVSLMLGIGKHTD